MQLWNDQETNNFYLINNTTGEQQRVYKTGQYLKEFDPRLTGKVGYKNRLRLATKPGYLPQKVKALENNYTFYTPKVNKLIYYTQCPRPKQLPQFTYFSTTNRLKSCDNSYFGSSTTKSNISKKQQSFTTYYNFEDSNNQCITFKKDNYKELNYTFDSQIIQDNNYNQQQKNQCDSISLKDFEKTLLNEQQQQDMFKLPQQKRECINTKGRFQIDIKTTRDFFKEDQFITKLLYPELFKEKKKNLQQEDLKKKINKLKELSILKRNLKLKK